MQRIPRFGVVLAGAAVLAALLLASSATGKSQAKPSNQQEPFIATKIAVVVGAKLTGDKGSWNGDRHLLVPVASLQRERDQLQERHQRDRHPVHRGPGRRRQHAQVPGDREEFGREHDRNVERDG